MDSVERVNILGCPFDAISFDETVAAVRNAVSARERLQIVPGSVDSVMKATRDPVFCAELWRSDLVVADGVPIVWAASLLGHPICGRVSGTELVWSCATISAETGCPVALIGAAPGIADRAAKRMREHAPGAVLHVIPTPYQLGPIESESIAEKVRDTGTGIVLVALGAPRQERWIQANLDTCQASVGVGVGSAFDIISGDKRWAPRWMREHGLEWLHRLLLEPKRLGKRYLIEDSPFLAHLAGAVVWRRVLRQGDL